MKTLTHDWELHQGAAVDELIPVTGLPITGVGVRCHIRDTLDALAPRLILSHDGPANRRVTVSAEGIRIQIGATVSGGLVMVQPRNRWVYDVEVYSLTDADDVLKPFAGTVYAYREATRESDTTALPPLASGDGRYLRIDGDQGLTPEQQAWAQHNSGTSPGGPGAATDHGALTGLADDDHTQYLNNARGDARYDAIGAATAAVSAHAGATDPHGDRAFATAAVATHAAAAGAHPMSGVDGLAAALALLSPLLSPALTGTPTAPTAAPGTASTQIASTAFVAAAIAALLNSAPGALDTLDELAAALGDDPNFATTVTSALAGKLAKASNLADLVDAAAARTNLGATTIGGQVFTAADAAAIRSLLTLGAAALLGVGTTAGTVAAGDHTHAGLTTQDLATWQAGAGTTDTVVSPAKIAAAIAALAPSGATPGGSTTQLQFNNAGALGGMSGTAWNDTDRTLGITGATVTTSKPILDLTQTWNAGAVAFTGLLFNVTNTASAATSKLLDLQVGGSSVFSVGRGADLGAGPEGGSSSASARFILWGSQSMIVQTGGGSTLRPFAVTSGLGGTGRPSLGACVISSGYLGFGSAAANSTPDAYFARDAAGTIALRDSTNAQTFRVYGTYTDSSNHVRGSVAASSTAVTVAAETAGTGADNVPLNLNSAGTSPVKAGNPFGYQSYTVATVPSASAAGAGANIYVSDESGGAVPAFSDGTDWRRYTDRAVIS